MSVRVHPECLFMEGLHVALEDSIEAGVFKGGQIHNGGESLSHLFYAYDAMCYGECRYPISAILFFRGFQ
ncbi:hypothetical protein HanIR_Chr02g0087561 [Helianthus annuus]|nr:hypothetical protein HanIR_Chr02g0087561 [Helianthus annuus]